MIARLRFLHGDSIEETIEIPPGEVVIGRDIDCHLQRESPFISRHHCVLLLDEYTLRIRDLGSKNGTFVNGRRIGGGETIVIDGDLVAVGEITFQVILVLALDRARSTVSGSPSAEVQNALEATGPLGDETFHGRGPAVSSSCSDLPASDRPSVNGSTIDQTGCPRASETCPQKTPIADLGPEAIVSPVEPFAPRAL